MAILAPSRANARAVTNPTIAAGDEGNFILELAHAGTLRLIVWLGLHLALAARLPLLLLWLHLGAQ
jgi:hypothetical protein